MCGHIVMGTTVKVDMFHISVRELIYIHDEKHIKWKYFCITIGLKAILKFSQFNFS